MDFAYVYKDDRGCTFYGMLHYSQVLSGLCNDTAVYKHVHTSSSPYRTLCSHLHVEMKKPNIGIVLFCI